MNNALKKTGFKAFLLISVTTGTILHNPYQSIANEGPSWSPRVSEKLVKLPGNFMEKAVDNDFQSLLSNSAVSKTKFLQSVRPLQI
jgi:hypothetical protein